VRLLRSIVLVSSGQTAAEQGAIQGSKPEAFPVVQELQGRVMQVRQELPNPAVAHDSWQGIAANAHDRRADNNSRSVHFEPERIVIMRRVVGVSMRVTIPVSNYNGIGVLLPNLAESRRGFQVSLVHDDPDLSVILHEDSNPLMIDAAIAEWAQYFGLPVIGDAAKPQSATVADDLPQEISCSAMDLPQPASQTTGIAPAPRRRGATLARRRPRLYARRKQGELVRMAEVHTNEREIIARH
jgi:hypothetical protein